MTDFAALPAASLADWLRRNPAAKAALLRERLTSAGLVAVAVSLIEDLDMLAEALERRDWTPPQDETQAPRQAQLRRLSRGFGRITFDAFSEILSRMSGACPVYCEGKWPDFQSGPLAFCLSRRPPEPGEAIIALAWQLGANEPAVLQSLETQDWEG